MKNNTHRHTPVTLELDGKKIPYKLFQHPQEIKSLEHAAKERGQEPNQIIRTIVFRCKKDSFIIVLMPGNRRVSWSALRKYVGQSRITMASEEEVLFITGYKLGAVSPFGLPVPLRILVDKSVINQEIISIGSGQRGLAVIIRSEDLLAALKIFELGYYSDQ